MEIRKHEYVIIFDLGEVIIDLNINQVIRAFTQASDKSSSEIIHLISRSNALIGYETGRYSDGQFHQAVCELLGCNMSMARLVEIWNSMLGYLNPLKIDLIRKLMDQSDVLILSNTNAIHERAFDEMVSRITGGSVFKEITTQAHYSHDLKMRKPDREIYEELNRLHHLTTKKVLFFR
jgi:FMN phosphatase YigB (HAD superfamily)